LLGYLYPDPDDFDGLGGAGPTADSPGNAGGLFRFNRYRKEKQNGLVVGEPREGSKATKITDV